MNPVNCSHSFASLNMLLRLTVQSHDGPLFTKLTLIDIYEVLQSWYGLLTVVLPKLHVSIKMPSGVVCTMFDQWLLLL